MTKRLAFVADTNVIVSRLFFRVSVPAQAMRYAAERMQLLLSVETVHELEEVLSRPKFEKYLSHNARLQFLRRLRSTALLVRNVNVVAVCRDPKDDKFLALALAGEAALILSGDEDLLVLHPFQGIQVLSPRQYLEQARERGA